MEFSLPPL